MKPVYLMIGPALLGACLSAQAQDTNTPEQNRPAPAKTARCASPPPRGSCATTAGHRGPGRGLHEGLQCRRRRGHRRDLHERGPGRRRGGRAHPRPSRHPRPVRRVVQGQPRKHDRDPGRLPAVPRPGDGARGGPGDHHSGQGGRGTRDQPASPPSTSRKTATGSRPPFATNRPATSPPTTGSRSWSGWSGNGSTRARRRSSSRPASGPTTAISCSASSPSRPRASP